MSLQFMFRFSRNSIFLLLFSIFAFSAPAVSATIPDGQEAAVKPDVSDRREALQYQLATVPSTNRKRVDAMCVKFLSVIPKAMLIPKTEESTVYRLIADTFDTVEPTKKRKTELLRHCESPFVLKGEQGYAVIAGSQLSEELAVAEQKRLAGRNIPTTIQKLRLPLKQWQMRSSESFSIRDAVLMASRLAGIGVITTIEQTARQMPPAPGE